MEKSVYELQQMALDKNVDIEELLRKAYLMAVSTNQKDIEKWVLYKKWNCFIFLCRHINTGST